MHDGQLWWSYCNRGRAGAGRDHMQPVSDLAQEVLKAAQSRAAARSRVEALVIENGGGDLLVQATILGVRNGVVYMQVSEPAILYHVRLTWERWLHDLLRDQGRDLGVSSVRFMVGRQH